MAQRVIMESFDSLYELLYTVDTRPKNEVMKDCNSSHKNDYSFTGTPSYEEAEKLAKYGYTELLPKIREGNPVLRKLRRKLLRRNDAYLRTCQQVTYQMYLICSQENQTV